MCPHSISVEKYCPACARKYAQDDESLTCAEDDTVLLPITQDLLLGRVIEGKYEIQELIGAGGSSSVYRAWQAELSRMVAFKLLRTDLVSSAEKIQRFGTEARLSSRLIHKNVCTVYDFGILASGQPYLVLELVEGKSLAKVLKEEGILSVSRAVHLLKEVATGLKEAHVKGIIHRDLKPSNIMVVNVAGNESVKLIDFGLAKTFDLDLEDQIASSGYMVGTPSYMSPEQVLGQTLDTRTDIYSLGCVLYEMLTGKKAVDGATAFEIMSKHVQTGPDRMEELTIPDELQALTFKCLQKDPQKRCQSMQEVADVLGGIKGDTSSFPQAIRRIKNRMHRPSDLVVLSVVAVAVLGLSWFALNATILRPAVTSGTPSTAGGAVQPNSGERFITQFKDFDAKNEPDEAEALGKRGFAWMKAHGQQNTPEMIQLSKLMQRLYLRQMRTKETAPYIEAIFQAQKAIASKKPNNDDELLQVYKEAGNNYYTSNHELEAQPYLREWLARTEKKWGADSKECTDPLMSLVRSNIWAGRHKDADAYFRRLHTLCDKYYATDNDFRLGVLREGGELYSQIGDYKQASALADQAIALSAKSDPRLRAQILDRATRTAASGRDYEKAIRLADHAITAYANWSPTQSLGDQDRLLVLQARYLREIKKFDESEKALTVALKRLSKHYTDSTTYRWAIDEYVKTLRASGRTTEADAVRRSGKPKWSSVGRLQ